MGSLGGRPDPLACAATIGGEKAWVRVAAVGEETVLSVGMTDRMWSRISFFAVAISESASPSA